MRRREREDEDANLRRERERSAEEYRRERQREDDRRAEQCQRQEREAEKLRYDRYMNERSIEFERERIRRSWDEDGRATQHLRSEEERASQHLRDRDNAHDVERMATIQKRPGFVPVDINAAPSNLVSRSQRGFAKGQDGRAEAKSEVWRYGEGGEVIGDTNSDCTMSD